MGAFFEHPVITTDFCGQAFQSAIFFFPVDRRSTDADFCTDAWGFDVDGFRPGGLLIEGSAHPADR